MKPRPAGRPAVVAGFLVHFTPTYWRYGNELCQQLDLKPGSMYPILMWLADRGLLEATWDNDAPAGRPPRHLYRLTGSGRALAADLAAAPARRPDLQVKWQGA
jgi:DNA-binding PadR family transcriptional regulator